MHSYVMMQNVSFNLFHLAVNESTLEEEEEEEFFI